MIYVTVARRNRYPKIGWQANAACTAFAAIFTGNPTYRDCPAGYRSSRNSGG